MSRRHPDFNHPAPAPWTWRDTAVVTIIVLTVSVLGIAVLVFGLVIDWPGGM